MNSKRIFSLLLTLMMVFAVLTGCGNAKDKIIEQIAAEQTQTEVPDETSAVEETTTEEATETETEKTEADVEETVAEETEERNPKKQPKIQIKLRRRMQETLKRYLQILKKMQLN